ncbi:hypothetical protein [Aeromonas veronii]|uniref:hypothetical protein n=1 Tax=Aeromonas veronii TaxID=654 RepID=UPI0032ED2F52
MKHKQMILSLSLLLGTTLGAIAPAHAISDAYRQKLERSGCTQMTDGNGCDIHKTRAQNHAAAAVHPSAPATLSTNKVAEILDRAVSNKPLDAAVTILLGAGWQQDDDNGLVFYKESYQATLDVNQKNDVVMGTSVTTHRG